MSTPSPLDLDLFRPGVRLAGRYLLSCAREFSQTTQLDLTPSLVLAALMCRNVADGAASGATPLAPGLTGMAPSSVYSTAKRVRLPYETTRRHIKRLEAHGLCTEADAGYIVGPDILASPPFQTRRLRALNEVRDLRRNLGEIGLPLPAWPNLDGLAAGIAVSRLSVAFFIDGLAVLSDALGLDLLPSLMFLTINQANTRDLTTDLRLARRLSSPDALQEDEGRRRLSVYEVARAMQIPYETARRHAKVLVDAGFCQNDHGLAATSEILLKPSLVEAARASWTLTVQFLEDVGQVAAGEA